MKRVQAVIFDMDGVLVDTEATYLAIEDSFFKRYGVELTEAERLEIAGGSSKHYRAAVREWWKRAQVPTELKWCDPMDLLDAYFAEQMPPLETLANPGLVETLESLKERNITIALASSSPMQDILKALEACGVTSYFSFALSGDELAESKPNPEIYLLALERLGLDADACIAVEDSDKGIAAALGAGLRVAVKQDARLGFKQEGGTWYIDSLPEVVGIVDAENDA